MSTFITTKSRPSFPFAVSLILAGSLALHAGTELKNDLSKMDLEDSQHFFYEKGYKDGVKEGYDKGYADALAYAKQRLRRYAKKIEAIENGKYLVGIGKISPPEVYQVQDGDSIKVNIMGCRIEKPLSPDEIIGLPSAPEGSSVMTSGSGSDKPDVRTAEEDEVFKTNAVSITAHDRSIFSGNAHGIAADKGQHYYFVPNNRYYRQKLDQMGYVYAVKNSKLKVLFPSKRDMDDFKRTFIEN